MGCIMLKTFILIFASLLMGMAWDMSDDVALVSVHAVFPALIATLTVFIFPLRKWLWFFAGVLSLVLANVLRCVIYGSVDGWSNLGDAETQIWILFSSLEQFFVLGLLLVLAVTFSHIHSKRCANQQCR